MADALYRPNGKDLATTASLRLPIPLRTHPPVSGVPPSVSSIARPVPLDKLNDLSQVICAINNYSINLEEMVQQQALDPNFR